jgi:hypothetical protein
MLNILSILKGLIFELDFKFDKIRQLVLREEAV